MLSPLLIASWAGFCKPGLSACSICLFPFECCLKAKLCACPCGRLPAFLPGTPDSRGMAACAGETPLEPAMKCLRWFAEQALVVAGTDRRCTGKRQCCSPSVFVCKFYAGFFPLCFGTGTCPVPLHHCF